MIRRQLSVSSAELLLLVRLEALRHRVPTWKVVMAPAVGGLFAGIAMFMAIRHGMDGVSPLCIGAITCVLVAKGVEAAFPQLN